MYVGVTELFTSTFICHQGVVLKCSNSNGDDLSCYSKELPPNSAVIYKCETPFYSPRNGGSRGGKLTCLPNGRWSPTVRRIEGIQCELSKNPYTSYGLFLHMYQNTLKLNSTFITDCGTALDPGAPLVIDGNVTKGSLWPWHASIFRRISPESPFRYICGGTLIKPLTYNPGFLILSAAHCFATEGGDSPDGANYKVILGAETSVSVEGNSDVPNVQIHNVS